MQDCHFEDNNGGVECSNGALNVRNSEFRFNVGSRGAAIWAPNSLLNVFDSEFESNVATWEGGAILASAPHVTQFKNSRFQENRVDEGSGAAVMFYGNESIYLEFSDCDFIYNSAEYGATIELSGEIGSTDIFNCLFAGNNGVEVVNPTSYYTHFWSNTFTHSTVENVLRVDNSNGTIKLTRCLIADNYAQAVEGSLNTVTSCNVFANYFGDYVGPLTDLDDGVTNFSADPQFCDPFNNDFSLHAMSPCLTANSPLAVPADVGSRGQGCGTTSDIDDQPLPPRYVLEPASPNPFNPSTKLSFSLPEMRRVGLRVFDLAGRRIRTLIADESVPAGVHAVTWNGTDDSGRSVGSGVYLVRLQAGEYVQTQRVLLVK